MGSDHGGHDRDDGELELVLALIGVLLVLVVVGRCHEVVLDGRGGGRGGGHVALDVVGVDELLGNIVVEDGRCNVEEIVVVWIDHKGTLQHGFVVVSVVQCEKRNEDTVLNI
jgi:hypothetical protein